MQCPSPSPYVRGCQYKGRVATGVPSEDVVEVRLPQAS